ncbi:MAG: serine/threonine protein kinase, partial [Actinobacteria bacterium]|nr:serine/threonine protein kinase [Actinomycetota bacterium]
MAYETIRRLGRGGTGVVDLARAPDGREVALKRLSLHGTPEELEKARVRIRREAEVLRQLHHPALVALLDVFDDGDDLVLVMDFLPGGNLSQRVADQGPLPADEVRRLGDRLLDGLAAAHRQGVVHRDIKPANVLFDADGNALLADFGAAIHRDATPGLTASEVVVGTPGFMSPEQARGETATAASDVFSLGATLAFAATGQGPFGTAEPRVLMLRAAAGRTE